MLNRFQPKGEIIYLKQSVSKWMLRIGKSFNPLTPMSDQDRILLTISIQYQPDK